MKRTLSRSAFWVLTAIVASLAAVSVQAQDERLIGGGAGITVFKDRDFRGSAATYTRDMPNLLSVGFDNNISSIRVAAGEQWQICDQTSYRGACVTVSGEESDLRKNNWDNRISSFRRLSGGGGPVDPPPANDYVVLYDQVNFRGNPTNYKGAVNSMRPYARSITVGGGTWQLCDGDNFTGRCLAVNTSVADLNTLGLSGRVRSLRPWGSVTTPPPPTQNPYVVLYTQSNYRGTPTTYRSARSRMVKSTGSVTVGAGVWELCTGNNYTGTCRKVDSSVANMMIFGVFSRTIRSLRPITPQPR